jgi:hypothetical protein
LEILFNNIILLPAHHLQVVIVIVQQGVVDVPIFNIDNTGNGMVVLIAVWALNHIAPYTHMRNYRARATLAARLAINGFRYVNVAHHTYLYAKTIPHGCAMHKIIVDAVVNYLASLISMR